MIRPVQEPLAYFGKSKTPDRNLAESKGDERPRAAAGPGRVDLVRTFNHPSSWEAASGSARLAWRAHGVGPMLGPVRGVSLLASGF